MLGFKDNNCPNCGASLRIDGRRRICEYCGYQGMEPEPEKTDDFYNLIVFNESAPSDDINVSIPECNIGYIVRGGEAVAKDVPAGLHTVMVSADGMVEYRSVNVPGDGRAVKVYVTKGVLGLAIRIDEPGANNPYGFRNGSVNQRNTFPILALVFSIIMPLLGLVFAVIDYSNCKKQGRKVSGYTLAAFVIFGIRFVLYILYFVIFVLIGVFR